MAADDTALGDASVLDGMSFISLQDALLPDEQVAVVVRGQNRGGLVATDQRLLLNTDKAWLSHPYDAIRDVDIGTGFKKWLALRGPDFPAKEPGFGDFKGNWALQAKSDDELRHAQPRLRSLIRAHAGRALPDAVRPAFTTSPRESGMPGQGLELLAEAEGSGGHIWVWWDRLRIKAFGLRGVLTKGVLKGDKDIWLDQISGIQWRDPGSLSLGHIQFTLIGGSTDSKRASEDENAVQFEATRRQEFERVKLVVEERIRALRLERSMPPQPPPSVGTSDVMETLRKLGELRDAGILTEAEFEQKKRDLLERI